MQIWNCNRIIKFQYTVFFKVSLSRITYLVNLNQLRYPYFQRKGSDEMYDYQMNHKIRKSTTGFSVHLKSVFLQLS